MKPLPEWIAEVQADAAEAREMGNRATGEEMRELSVLTGTLERVVSALTELRRGRARRAKGGGR